MVGLIKFKRKFFVLTQMASRARRFVISNIVCKRRINQSILTNAIRIQVIHLIKRFVTSSMMISIRDMSVSLKSALILREMQTTASLRTLQIMLKSTSASMMLI